MSRGILDSLGLVDGLVVAAGVEGQFADELAVLEDDDADVLVGDVAVNGPRLSCAPRPNGQQAAQ